VADGQPPNYTEFTGVTNGYFPLNVTHSVQRGRWITTKLHRFFRVTISYHTVVKAEQPFLSVQFNSANELTGKNLVIYSHFAIFNELVGILQLE
jgi:hypothetical protein